MSEALILEQWRNFKLLRENPQNSEMPCYISWIFVGLKIVEWKGK